LHPVYQRNLDSKSLQIIKGKQTDNCVTTLNKNHLSKCANAGCSCLWFISQSFILVVNVDCSQASKMPCI